MNRPLNRIRGGAAALVVFMVAAPAVAQQQAWQVDGGEVTVRCQLTLGGSFDAVTPNLSGRLSVAEGPTVQGVIDVDLRTLDTGIGLRNRHMRDQYLEVDRGEPFERAVLSDVVLQGVDAADAAGTVTFSATLRLHGVERPVEGTAELSRDSDDLRVVAVFPVSLESHGVPAPRYLGVGVRDEVRVEVRFEATAVQR